MEFLILALLGIGAASVFFDFGSSSDDAGNAPPPDQNTEGRTIVLESGTPNPAGGSGDDSFSGIVEGTVRAGAGDDRFDFEDGYGARIFGGSGNDSFEGGFGDNFILNGGSGEDVFGFTADTFDGAGANGGAGNDSFTVAFPDVPNSAGAALSGGDGVDTFNLSFTSVIAFESGAGQLAVLKDFKPGVDVLDIDVEGYSRAELIENADGGFTDLRLHFSAMNPDGAAVERYAMVRLEGITGTTLADLGVTLPEPPDSQGRLYEIAPGGLGLVNGGSGNDTISGIADGQFFGGGGDDLFEIEDGVRATLGGGAGNDSFVVSGELINLRGGEGNDTVSGDLLGGSVFGDGGDDLLRTMAGPSDPVFLYGGGGNDTLDGSVSSNTVLEGGTGDDLIVTDGAGSGGAGYNIIARGGAGDDTLSHSVEVLPPLNPNYDQPTRLTGGAGADAFTISLTIGDGTFEASADDPEVFTTPAGLLEDFLRGTDSLTIDLSAINDTYSTVSAQMIEDGDNGTTDIILGLSDDTNPRNDVVIRVAATGLSWDDITFSGRDPTFLNAA